MKIKATIELWQKGKWCIAKVPELDFVAQGETIEEAKANLEEVIRIQFAEMKELGTLYNIDKDLMKKCRTPMKKYHDLPMDLADATLIAVAEAENISTIFTLDHKDFKVYKTRLGKHFRILPEKL